MIRLILTTIVAGLGPVLLAQPEIPLRLRVEEVARRAAREPGLLVVVDGTVVGPLGPRVFAIRDSRFLDPDGDVLVAVTAPLVAAVTERVRVHVIGRLHPAVSHDDALGIPLKPLFRSQVPRMPLVVAESVTGPDGAQLAVRLEDRGRPVVLARAATARKADLVGRWLDGSPAHVLQTRPDGMFWVGPSSGPTPRLFVVPAAPMSVRSGERVELRGLLLRLPRAFANTLRDRNVTRDEPIYLFAADVRTASARARDGAGVLSVGGPII